MSARPPVAAATRSGERTRLAHVLAIGLHARRGAATDVYARDKPYSARGKGLGAITPYPKTVAGDALEPVVRFELLTQLIMQLIHFDEEDEPGIFGGYAEKYRQQLQATLIDMANEILDDKTEGAPIKAYAANSVPSDAKWGDVAFGPLLYDQHDIKLTVEVYLDKGTRWSFRDFDDNRDAAVQDMVDAVVAMMTRGAGDKRQRM